MRDAVRFVFPARGHGGLRHSNNNLNSPERSHAKEAPGAQGVAKSATVGNIFVPYKTGLMGAAGLKTAGGGSASVGEGGSSTHAPAQPQQAGPSRAGLHLPLDPAVQQHQAKGSVIGQRQVHQAARGGEGSVPGPGMTTSAVSKIVAPAKATAELSSTKKKSTFKVQCCIISGPKHFIANASDMLMNGAFVLIDNTSQVTIRPIRISASRHLYNKIT